MEKLKWWQKLILWLALWTFCVFIATLLITAYRVYLMLGVIE